MAIRIDPQSVCWSKIENETLLLNLDSGFYYTLDEVGGFIWELLAAGQEKPGILTRLLSDYHIEDLQSAENDVDAFLMELRDEGLIEFEDGRTAPPHFGN
jgi:hypothetical protein